MRFYGAAAIRFRNISTIRIQPNQVAQSRVYSIAAGIRESVLAGCAQTRQSAPGRADQEVLEERTN